MEDEAQKMLALKKAYADIILNTVKEAAARVMVSERKALRFQQDLCYVKDDALRMLIRLKNMIDSKMKEAEKASLCQRIKVEELEAQLHEAEDVITDLRMQLKEARYQLEKVKNGQVQPLEGKIMNKITFCSKSTFVESNPFYFSTSEPQTVSPSLKNMKTKQIALDATNYNGPNPGKQSTISQVDVVYSHDSDFTSTVVRTKDHEVYRNSCNPGIATLERNFLDCKLPLVIDVKAKQVRGENEPLAKKRGEEETGLSTRNGKDIGKNVHAAELKRSVNFHTSRRRKSRFEKYRRGSCRLQGSQHMKSRQPPSLISLCRLNLRDGNVRYNKNGYVLPSLMADRGNVTQDSCMLKGHESNSYKDENGIFYGSKTKENMKRGNLNAHLVDQLIKPCDKSFVLSPCRTSINLVNDSMKSSKYHSNMTENENKIKQLTRLDPGFTSTKRYVEPMPVSTCVTTSVKAINRSRVIEDATDSNGELMALPVNQESDATGNLIFPSFQLNSEMNINMEYEKIFEVTNSSPCQVEKKTPFRYTLQRKRKKEATSISDENISPENSNGKRRLVEKLKCEPEFERSVLVRELSRESRPLSQVVRQLISLSEKRWWQ